MLFQGAHFAAFGGHMEICEYILEYLTDLNPSANDGRTPLHFAAIKGHLHVCKGIMNNLV